MQILANNSPYALSVPRIRTPKIFPVLCLAIIFLGPSTSKAKGLFSGSPRTSQQDIDVLDRSRSLVRKISGGKVHRYLIHAPARTYMHIEVEQRAIDVVLSLFRGDGKTLIDTVDNPYGTSEPELLLYIAEEPGDLILEITALEASADPGRYEIRIKEWRPVRLQDIRRVNTERATRPLLMEAEKLLAEFTSDSFEAGIQKYKEVLRLWRIVGDRQRELRVLADMGVTFLGAAQPEEALKIFNQALGLISHVRSSEDRAFLLSLIGVAYYRMEEVEKSQMYERRAQQLTKALGRRYREAHQLQNLGDGYYDLANYQSALETYKKALLLYQDHGGQRDVAIILNNIGATYRALGMDDQSLEYFGQALPLLQHPDNADARATALYNTGTIYISKDEVKKALGYFEQALPLSQLKKDEKRVGEILNLMGYAYFKLGDYAKATQSYEDSIKVWQTIRNKRGEAHVLHDLGGMYFTRGDSQKALGYYEQALKLTRLAQDSYAAGAILDSIGNLQLRDGRIQSALDSYLSSLKLGEEIRSTSTLGEFKRNFENELVDTYQSAALLHMKLGQSREAFEISERARARTFLDELGNLRLNLRKSAEANLLSRERALLRELDNLNYIREEIESQVPEDASKLLAINNEIARKQKEYSTLLTNIKLSNPQYLTLRTVETQPLPKLQQLLDSDTTLLSYFITRRVTIVFLITRSGFRAFEIPISEETLRAHVLSFRRFDDISEAHPNSLKELYDLIIAPIRPYLKTPTIGVIPHGVLHYLSFAALWDGNDYLGDKHTIFTLPNANVLPYLLSKRKSSISTLLALSQRYAAMLPELENVDREVKSIARLFKVQPLTTGQGTKDRLLAKVSSSDVIHIAAHGQLNPSSPLFSRLYLAPTKSDNGFLDVHEIYSWDLRRVNLVVLSACETYLGDHNKGDDMVGLTRAFIYAGVPSVISSLWTVDDEATSLLMMEFYKNLRAGKPKAEALRLAQRYVRTNYRNPFYWAGFVLTGDPGN